MLSACPLGGAPDQLGEELDGRAGEGGWGVRGGECVTVYCHRAVGTKAANGAGVGGGGGVATDL